jgi:acyl-CoA thioester hydrolase
VIHHFPVTVFYEDTDMGGIVYHAKYLHYIERARSAFVHELGIDQNALREAGQVFVVHRIEADFRAPARLDDVLRVETRVESVSAARMVLAQDVILDGRVLFAARVTVALLDRSSRPARLPAVLRALPGSAGM